MRHSSLRPVLLAGLLVLALSVTRSAEAADKSTGEHDQAKPIRIGAVAYAPSAVTIFEGIKHYLEHAGLPADYVLYSNYDALVAALAADQIDIAWNTPLAHAKYHVLAGGKSQTLVMRDVDRDFHSVLIARQESGIKSPADLAGKRLVLGSCDAAEAVCLPMHFLAEQGVDCASVTQVSLDKAIDLRGNPCSSEGHVLAAVQQGHGDAGVIGERLWQRVQKEPAQADGLICVWRSPSFSHCVFTASADFDSALAKRFTDLMLAMNPDDPETSELMRLEGTRKWLRGTTYGFATLIEVVERQQPLAR